MFERLERRRQYEYTGPIKGRLRSSERMRARAKRENVLKKGKLFEISGSKCYFYIIITGFSIGFGTSVLPREMHIIEDTSRRQVDRKLTETFARM